MTIKLVVRLRRIREEFCVIEVQNLDHAKTVIEGLIPDCFSVQDEYHEIEVENELGENIYGDIQPYCPRI